MCLGLVFVLQQHTSLFHLEISKPAFYVKKAISEFNLKLKVEKTVREGWRGEIRNGEYKTETENLILPFF